MIAIFLYLTIGTGLLALVQCGKPLDMPKSAEIFIFLLLWPVVLAVLIFNLIDIHTKH